MTIICAIADVVHAGPAEILVFQGKTQRFDEIHHTAGCHGSPENIARIAWNLRLE